MEPSYCHGDWVLVLRSSRLRPGVIAAVRDPRQPDRILIKRVIRREVTGWWVTGDNPAASTDSRTFGPVPPELVVGRVLLRYYPWRRPASGG